jgi:SAM domain (Sterile alpha motif)
MRRVTDWLEKLGVPEYAERFAENDIDFTLLPELSDQDLEKIGVASLGHRRRILKAIAALERTPAAAPADPASEAFAPLAKHAAAAKAGVTDAAIEWWGNAGDQALHRSAFRIVLLG